MTWTYLALLAGLVCAGGGGELFVRANFAITTLASRHGAYGLPGSQRRGVSRASS